MNFLIKIEEIINQLLIHLWAKIKVLIPTIIFRWIESFTNLPTYFKHELERLRPILRIKYLKTIGHLEHYITILRGYLTTFILYLKSGELKKKIKPHYFLDFFKHSASYLRANPKKMIISASLLFCVTIITSIFYQNIYKIISGTRISRNISSSAQAPDYLFIDLLNHKLAIKIEAAQASHGAADNSNHEHEINLNIKIEALDAQEKEYLIKMKDVLEHHLETIKLQAEQLPLSTETKHKIEENLLISFNKEFDKMGHNAPIKKIIITQVIPARPLYYRQSERILSVVDINLQMFLEDTQRNRQVWIDFSIIASNRNVILYLQDHEVEFKDHLMNNIEPVIPHLPIEDEGKRIIKDKIKMELDDFLEKNNIEGKILEVYIEHLVVS